MAKPPQPRKLPSQARSQQLVNALKEACTQLLAQGKADDLTLAMLTAESGVAAASFYEYFPNIESLITAILNDKLAASLDTLFDDIQATPEETPLREVIGKIIRVCVENRLELYQTAPDIFMKYISYYETTEHIPNAELISQDPFISARRLLEQFQHQMQTPDLGKSISLFVNQILFVTRWVITEKQYMNSLDHSIELFTDMALPLFEVNVLG